MIPREVQQPRKCLFCGQNGPLTREHIFPGVLVRSFPEGTLEGDAAHLHGSRHEGFDDWIALPWQMKNIDQSRVPAEAVKSSKNYTTKKICAACNNGWMSDVENRMSWFFTAAGRSVRDSAILDLDSHRARVATRWALMKTALFLADQKEAIPLGFCEAVAADSMPSGCVVELLVSKFAPTRALALNWHYDAEDGHWICVIKTGAYYLRVFHSPASAPTRMLRCIRQGVILHPYLDRSMGFHRYGPDPNVGPPRTSDEELVVLTYLVTAPL